MNKIDLGKAVTILANLGVIAGIIFLGIELRQNNELLRAEARAVRAEFRVSATDQIANNPALVRAAVKEQNGEALTADERFLLQQWSLSLLARLQYVHGEYQRGLIDEDDVPIDDWRLLFSRFPALGVVWQQQGHISYRPDFVQFMEENVVKR